MAHVFNLQHLGDRGHPGLDNKFKASQSYMLRCQQNKDNTIKTVRTWDAILSWLSMLADEGLQQEHLKKEFWKFRSITHHHTQNEMSNK